MPLAVLVAGDLVSGRRPQPPAPSVTLNPIRTRWMEHLGRRPPCLRIMPFRTSCGRPDPAAGAVCGGHDRVFPALWAPRLSPWSSWPVMSIPTRRARQAGFIRGEAPARWIKMLLTLPVLLAALSPTPTRWTVHLERPTGCHRITRWRTSCGQLDPAAGVACGAMAGCFRHCRRHDVERGADAWA